GKPPSNLLWFGHDRSSNQDDHWQQHSADDGAVLGIEVQVLEGTAESEGPSRERDSRDDNLADGRRGALLTGGDRRVDGSGDQEAGKDQPVLLRVYLQLAALDEAFDENVDRDDFRGDVLDEPGKITIPLRLGIRWRRWGGRTSGDRYRRGNSWGDAT